MKGNLFIISGPSGSGKSTICKQVVQQDPHIQLSVSATTRTPREGEVDGVNYHFLSKEVFEQKIENGEFYEYAHVYGNIYGTLKAQVEEKLCCGNDVILEIEMQGAKQVKEIAPHTKLIFIMPPSLDELAQRLAKRDTETPEQIRMRFESAQSEIAMNQNYDHIVVNDDLQRSVQEVLDIIHSYRLS